MAAATEAECSLIKYSYVEDKRRENGKGAGRNPRVRLSRDGRGGEVGVARKPERLRREGVRFLLFSSSRGS